MINLKPSFEEEKKKIKKSFSTENSGLKNCRRNSDLVDKVINQIFSYQKKEKKISFEKFFISAVGGYGRRQLAPFSDIDLLFVYDDKKIEDVESLVKDFLYPLWDLGLKVGYAVRSLKESIVYSGKDQIIKTSMLDTRLVCGSKKLFNELLFNFFKQISKKPIVFIDEKINERRNRIKLIGFDYFKNEPNIKESEGSLRDLNLISWGLKVLEIIKKSYGAEQCKFLTKFEKKKIKLCTEFLLTMRCHLHYESDRLNDKLSFDYQKIISEKLSFTKKKSTNTKVELMMRMYFEQIRVIKVLTQNLIGNMREFIRLNGKIKGTIDFRKTKEKVKSNVFSSLRDIHFQREIINNIEKINSKYFFSKNNIENFKKFLLADSNDEFIHLCEIGVVGKILPEFSRIQNLTQFDRYHALTVGQHTLKALSTLKGLKKNNRKESFYKFAKKIFSKNFNKKPLYFATLFHDFGKGLDGNHHKKGAKIAESIVSKLNENKEIARETSWLVENHLLLSEFAFKKDIQDFSVIKNISSLITNIDRLNSLFILTVADISAVDHGIWNDWKANLLESLYLKIEEEILNPEIENSVNKKIQLIKDKILTTSKSLKKLELQEFAKITYPNYWLLQAPESIKFQIEKFFLKGKKIKLFDFHISQNLEKKFFKLTLVTKDRPSLFLDIISAFVLEKFSILEARIFTLDDGTVIDTFKFSFSNRNLLEEFEINEKITRLKNRLIDVKNQKIPTSLESSLKKGKVLKRKIDINFDNDSSKTYSVFEVVTNDRIGLLYDISKILIKNKFIISMAKISTNGDFVEDSFHLRNEFGFKIEQKDLIEKLKREIINFLT